MKPQARGRSPNILMIMTDQQRWDSLGVTGAKGYATPNLDNLADEGVLFNACYCDNPICTPSRASLFTGKSLPGHGVYRLHDILPADQTPFPYLLRQEGYETALFGKWHLSGRLEEEERRHSRDGFDHYEWCLEASVSLDSPLNAYGRWLEKQDPAFYTRLFHEKRKLGPMPAEYSFTHWAADRTINFLEERNSSDTGVKPWFCLMSVFDPHNPYDDVPSSYIDRVENVEPAITDPTVTNTDITALKAELEHSYLGASANFGQDDIEEMRRGYAASLVLLDDEVGRVLKVLEEQGLQEDTLVIFTSDHGDMLGDHGLFVKGAFFYDPGVRVPLIIRYPGVLEPGIRVSEPVQLRDLAMTVMTAAGVPGVLAAQPDVDSVDLAVLARGKKVVRDSVCCMYRNSGINDKGDYWNPAIHATMIRRGDWKLNWYHGSPPKVQLFNLVDDPYELTDLSCEPDSAGVRRELTELLLEELAREERCRGSRGGDARPRENQKLSNFQRTSS